MEFSRVLALSHPPPKKAYGIRCLVRRAKYSCRNLQLMGQVAFSLNSTKPCLYAIHIRLPQDNNQISYNPFPSDDCHLLFQPIVMLVVLMTLVAVRFPLITPDSFPLPFTEFIKGSKKIKVRDHKSHTYTLTYLLNPPPHKCQA